MRVEEAISIRARPSTVWQLVGDPPGYSNWMGVGITWHPIEGDAPLGVGARYTTRMRVGSAEIGGLVEVVEYDAGSDVAWHSVSGIDQRGRFRLREIEPGTTRVTMRLSYQSPGGVWGVIADRVSSVEVRRKMRRSLDNLRQLSEPATARRAEEEHRPANFTLAQLRAVRVLTDVGILQPFRPDRLIAAALALHRWGMTLPGALAVSATRYPKAVALIDDERSETSAELDGRTNALANALAAGGLSEGERVGILCRNHAGFAESVLALAKLGADPVLLNTGFARPQLQDVLRREGITAVLHDAEFGPLIGDAIRPRRRFVVDGVSGAARGSPTEPAPPERRSQITILTSGTTGAPKGASRSQPNTTAPVIGLLSAIPLRARGTTVIAAPLFHAWGFAHLALGLALSSTLVLQRRFDPEQTLAAVERHRASALVAVPVMLRRMLELAPDVRARYDTASLRVVAVSGSSLSGELARAFMDEFGDVLYNLYGSTEVAAATIASPSDLRVAPGTAGRPPYGSVVKVFDDHGKEVVGGRVGRIFVGNEMLFEGYTGGDGREMIEGLMATGDVGHFDSAGRLFVEGRSDDMIVSGGENVFPDEVENLLAEHPDIVEAAVVGVADEEWGQRLAAYVVPRRGATLTVDDVKDHVRARLARYKVPRDVEFVQELPRNTTGKVLKSGLPANLS